MEGKEIVVVVIKQLKLKICWACEKGVNFFGCASRLFGDWIVDCRENVHEKLSGSWKLINLLFLLAFLYKEVFYGTQLLYVLPEIPSFSLRKQANDKLQQIK